MIMGKENVLKDYVEVNVRIMEFYKRYPEGRILTELVKWENETVVMKATAYRDERDIVASTGFAYEKENSSFINKTSALENCETSAVGRALAILGFEIKKSVASKEEVANAMLNQGNGPKISEAQIQRVYAIAHSKGVTKEEVEKVVKHSYKKEVKDLTKVEYDELCSRIEKKPSK